MKNDQLFSFMSIKIFLKMVDQNIKKNYQEYNI